MHLRAVARILGLLTIAMGLAMLPCAVLDMFDPSQDYFVFASIGALAILIGLLIAVATSGERHTALSVRDAFLLTTGTWVVLPLVGAVPFMAGTPGASFTDAYFEAVSGMTTTGSTVFVGLDGMPPGTLLWRGILQWLGGLGIVIVAMIFLPVMRIGGMQFFRSEGFDTMGKIMPRALDIARSLLWVYVGLTALCAAAYGVFGMRPFDAIVHALTTTSTGGFANYDASFARFAGPLEYVSALFMLLASMPFIRFVQLASGDARPLWRDVQVRAYLRWTLTAILVIAVYRVILADDPIAPLLREIVFNTVTLFSGTGYGSTDITLWGPFPFAVIFLVALIGGCTASTGCSVKVFRWLVAAEAIRSRLRRLRYPDAIARPRLGGRVLEQDVIDSVIAFFTFFLLTFLALVSALALTGLQPLTALTAAWTAIANVGPAWGPEVGPTGAMDGFPTAAKWLMIFGMLIGRLEILSVYVLLMVGFWRT